MCVLTCVSVFRLWLEGWRPEEREAPLSTFPVRPLSAPSQTMQSTVRSHHQKMSLWWCVLSSTLHHCLLFSVSVSLGATKGALDALTRVMALELGPHQVPLLTSIIRAVLWPQRVLRSLINYLIGHSSHVLRPNCWLILTCLLDLICEDDNKPLVLSASKAEWQIGPHYF